MTVTLSQLVLIPMLSYLCAVLACWLYYQFRAQPPRLMAHRNRIYRCQVCQHVYLDARDVPLARCPRCGVLNEAVRT